MYVVKHTSVKLVIHTWLLNIGGVYTIDCVLFPAIAKLLIIMMIHVELMCCLHRVSHSIKSHSTFHVKACLHVLLPYLILPSLFSVMCTCVILATAITEYYPHWPDSLHRLVLIWFCSYTHIEKQKTTKKQKTSVWSKIHIHTDTNTKWTLPWKRT